MQSRPCLYAVLLALALPVLVGGENEGESVPENPWTQRIIPEPTKAGWRRAEIDRCSSQASVSVDALLGYEPGRAAARKLMKLADQLRKHAESGSSVDQQTTHELLMQMQPEFWLMERTNRELRSLIGRSADEQLSRIAERLRVRPIADELIKAMQELNRNDSDTTALAQHAKQLKELVKQWRRGVKQAGKTLCLRPPHVFLLQ